MILIADSGSTKTHWSYFDGEKAVWQKQTDGINPFFRSPADIFDELSRELLSDVTTGPEEIHFYGAGIINSQKGDEIKRILAKLFPETKISTFSDLIAAARATCGRKAGIACILGTGSNSCLYDGTQIIEQISPLGFILGDEGSGAVMGRKLVGDYLKNVMPFALREKFATDFPITRDEILERVYRTERPNLFLASLAKFLYLKIGEEYCHEFVKAEFQLFVERNLLHYTHCQQYPVSSVGSVGYFFGDIFREVLKEKGLLCGPILRDPMEGLIQYYIGQ